MGCKQSTLTSIVPLDDQQFPNKSIYLSRLEGIRNIICISYTKEPFGIFLNDLPMSQDYLKLKIQEDFSKLDHYFLNLFIKLFKDEYNSFTNRNSLSVLSYLLNAKVQGFIPVLLNIFPKFFDSKYCPCHHSFNSLKRESRISYLSKTTLKSSSQPVSQLASISRVSGEKLTHSMNGLILALDNFKVAISIASVKPIGNENFPVMYVNPNFTILTGYFSNEIIGRNLKLLQAGKAEKECAETMAFALQEEQICQVAITNYRKDGMPFKCLVCLVPIYDDEGHFTYVVGLHFDVTKPGLRLEKQKLANEIINRIPKTIFSDDFNYNEDSLYMTATQGLTTKTTCSDYQI